jgi:hypothetical protein
MIVVNEFTIGDPSGSESERWKMTITSDGTLDGAEVTQGSDPGNHVDGGLPPAPGTTQAVEFTVGDPSGNHSERVVCVKFCKKEFGRRLLLGQLFISPPRMGIQNSSEVSM